ncbi:MAG TPA: cupin domain-containing protein [Acidimicrobiia bacterium]|jgi:quercetin dioxygenase-like cupin family protein|nr:cupin domain-containing protein [Acidimicrobiia bacterium]
MTVTPGHELHFDELPGRDSADPLLGLGAASSIRIVRLHPGRTRQAHRHPHSEEIVYVRTGHGTAFLDGTPCRVAPGDVVHVPPGVPHATIPDTGELMELICFFPHPSLANNLEETDIQVSIQEQP